MKDLLLKQRKVIESTILGEYAGWKPGRIFGTLDCASGMRMKEENRVFFQTLEDAVQEGYRPCKKCRPIDNKDFEVIKRLTDCKTVNEFYNRK